MNNPPVCPESTIDSAGERTRRRPGAKVPNVNANNSATLACESTIESANRRSFIKKAAFATAALGIGSALSAGNIVPRSSAASNKCCSGYFVTNSIVVDPCNLNNGHPCGCGAIYCYKTGESHMIEFGVRCYPAIACEIYSGIAIGSAVNASSNPNYKGLDFYTCYTKRVSITKCGKVGIGTTAPEYTLCVKGAARACGIVSTESSKCGVAITGCALGAGFSYGVLGYSKSACGAGVAGCSTGGTGVAGYGNLKGVHGVANVKTAIPLVAEGAPSQSANLQNWQVCTTIKSVVNPCGWLGVGATSAPTTLHVGGSISAKMANTGSKNYCMGATDFAVFACHASVTVTLPAADSAAGRIVFIKNTSSGSVTVAPYSGNCIEGSTSSKTLSKPYDSLMLMSNGSKKWVLMGNSIGDAFTS